MWFKTFLLVITILTNICKGHHVDLHNRGLRTVPANIPPSTDSLDLSENLLTTITNDSFVNLSSLTSLDLSANQLEQLAAAAFRGLGKLLSLKLNDNRLKLTYRAYPPSVFQPLPNLLTLRMDDNPSDPEIHTFPEKIFSSLEPLRFLAIDGLGDVPFGQGFLRMSRLKTLWVNHWGLLKSETLAVFANLTLRSLAVQCSSLERGSLRHFPYLTHLKVRTDGLNRALYALADFRYRKLSVIDLSGSNPFQSGRRHLENLALVRNNTVHLVTICVKRLDLSQNALTYVSMDLIDSFKYPHCLESLLVGSNFLWVATQRLLVFHLFTFPSLKLLDLSSVSTKGRLSDPASTEHFSLTGRGNEQVTFQFPPSLENLNVSFQGASPFIVQKVNVLNAQHLRTIDVAYSSFLSCVSVVAGLENITVLNMSGTDCRVMSPTLLSAFPSLQTLVVTNCGLGKGLQSDPRGVVFSRLEKLLTLDLSSNDLITFHKDLFKPLVKLEKLILRNNKLIKIPEAVFLLATIQFLDISSNVISFFSSDELKWLNKIASSDRNTDVSISMANNPYLCTCNTLTFIHWVLETSVNIVENGSLICNLQSGTETNIWSLKSQIRNMDVSCVSKFWLTFSVVASCLLTLSIILGIFGYRFRWNIKYWILTKCRRGTAQEELVAEQYQYDAFVAYNRHNYQWACMDLRRVLETENNYTVCLHDRDFPVGVSIQQNIVDSVNNSRKIILVVSRAFLRSDWSEFEIQMAGMRMVRDGRENAIIVIMVEEIPVAEMPRSLLNLWRHITFLLWDTDRPDEPIFWDRLLEVMARP